MRKKQKKQTEKAEKAEEKKKPKQCGKGKKEEKYEKVKVKKSNNDSRNSSRDSPAENSDGGHGVLLVGGLLASSTSSDHVGLQQSTLQQQVVVGDGLVGSGQHLLGDLDAGLEGVGTVRQDLGFDDGDQTVVLADGTITGQTGGVLLDGDVGGKAISLRDLQNSSPEKKKEMNK